MLHIQLTFSLFATIFLHLYDCKCVTVDGYATDFHSLIFNGAISLHLDANGQGVFVSALFLGEPNLFNTTRDDCYWKRGNERDRCPDKDIRMILFTGNNPPRRTEVTHSLRTNYNCNHTRKLPAN